MLFINVSFECSALRSQILFRLPSEVLRQIFVEFSKHHKANSAIFTLNFFFFYNVFVCSVFPQLDLNYFFFAFNLRLTAALRNSSCSQAQRTVDLTAQLSKCLSASKVFNRRYLIKISSVYHDFIWRQQLKITRGGRGCECEKKMFINIAKRMPVITPYLFCSTTSMELVVTHFRLTALLTLCDTDKKKQKLILLSFFFFTSSFGHVLNPLTKLIFSTCTGDAQKFALRQSH